MKRESCIANRHVALVLAVALLMVPTISFSQDFGGIAGALIQGAINAQRQQQYQDDLRRGYQEPRRRSRVDKESDRQDDKRVAAEKKAETTRLQQEEFDKIAPAAQELIDDASTFVKENPSNPKLLQYIKKIAALNSTLTTNNTKTTNNTNKLKSLMEGLVTDLRREPAYAKLSADRIHKKKMEAAQYLPELIKTATQQQTYIRDYITNNPTAPNTITFISLLNELESNLIAPDLEKMMSLTGKVDVSIRQAGLQDDFVKATNKLVYRAIEPLPIDKAVDVNLPPKRTVKNAFLAEGDPKDFVLMYNSSPKAPHVATNLKGDIEFDRGEAKACLYQPNFAKPQIHMLRGNLRKYKVPSPEIDSSECSRTNLLSYDVVAVERGELLKLRSDIIMTLYSKLEVGEFKMLGLISGTETAALALEQKNNRDRLDNDIQNGAAKGFGIIFVGSQVETLCMVVKDKEKAHRKIMLDNIERLTLEIDSLSPTSIVKPSLDDAYKALNRKECQAIYSSATEIYTVISALKRTETKYSISSVWSTEEEVAMAAKLLDERELAEKTRNQERLTKLKSDETLKAVLDKADRESSKKKQEALQSQYGKIAAASAAEIANVIREATEGRSDWQQSAAYVQFPQFATWYQNLVQNRWELQSFNSEIYDYGRAKWKERILETPFSKVSMRLRNRILGEYKDACFMFGRMKDAEFNMIRDTIEVACGQEIDLSSWKKVRSFESQWLVFPGI